MGLVELKYLKRVNRRYVFALMLMVCLCYLLVGQAQAGKGDPLADITKENVNDYDEKGWTPLLYEVMGSSGNRMGSPGNIKRIQHLLNLGANPNISEKGPRKVFPLEIAVRYNSKSTVIALVEGGANILDYTEIGPSLLHFAMDNENIFLYLLNKGANPNVNVHKNQSIPLLSSLIEKNKIDLAIALLKSGALPNKLCSARKPCVYWAVQNGNKDLVSHFIDHGAEIGGIAILRTISGKKPDLEMVKFLVDKGARIDEQDKNGNTALHIAKIYGNEEIVKFYIDQGADLTIRNNKNQTYLEVKLNR